MKRIIGLAGQAGSGKDTIASMVSSLVPKTKLIAQAEPLKELGETFMGFTKDQLYGPSHMRNATDMRFNDPKEWDLLSNDAKWDWLKKYLPHHWDENRLEKFLSKLRVSTLDAQVGLSPRTFLQQLGTEFGRSISPTVWNDIAVRRAHQALSSEANLVIITDIRFRNEIMGVDNAGGQVILVKNPQTETLGGQNATHQSEAELANIPEFWFDMVFINDKTKGLEHLESMVKSHLVEYKPKPVLG